MTTQTYSGSQLAKHLLPTASEWTLNHVTVALENITNWNVKQGQEIVLDTPAVIKEIKEMVMAESSRDLIFQELDGFTFTCKWTLPNFTFGQPGFALD